MTTPLYAAEPWKEHRFPHKRITRKVCRAKLPYRCDIHGSPPPGHVSTIQARSVYLRVSLRPSRSKAIRDRWTTVRLCRACALHLGLATETRPEAFA